MAAKKRSWHFWPIVVVLSIAMALLSSACLWGFVTDTDSGVPISGATVAYTDADGNTGSTTTAASGLYAFDIADGPVPGVGTASFEISADGYHTKTEPRLIGYDDNPSASIADPSSFWEVQSFTLQEEGEQSIEVELTSVDISLAFLMTLEVVDYTAAISAYDPDDPGGTLCHQETGWYPVTSLDPPPQSLSLECSVPGDTLEVRVYVGVRRVPYLNQPVEHNNSTAGFSWVAPRLETSWQRETLDSTDAAGPDDPYLEFTAEIRYRSVEVAP